MGLDPDDLPYVEDEKAKDDVHNIDVTGEVSETDRKNPHRMFDALAKSKVAQVKKKKSV